MPKSNQHLYSGNGSVASLVAIIKVLAVLASLILSGISFERIVFSGGRELEAIQQHLNFDDRRLDDGEKVWARKDVLDERIRTIEINQTKEEQALSEENKLLTTLVQHLEENPRAHRN